MCGPSRPSSGGRIAVLFPTAPTPSQINSYSILFHNPDSASTKATFRAGAGCLDLQTPIDLRIEKYGDLTSSPTYTTPPLHVFRLHPRPCTGSSSKAATEMECELPERLDLGISERGIVGRQVTVVAGGRMGMGVVGFD